MKHDKPAYPIPLFAGEQLAGGIDADGLTRRELFAAMAMQGVLSGAEYDMPTSIGGVASLAVDYADALIKELDK